MTNNKLCYLQFVDVSDRRSSNGGWKSEEANRRACEV